MLLDHASICDLAKQIGRSTKDLVALSTSNDPFYVDVPRRKAEAEWFANLWQQLGATKGTNIRRLHYLAVTRAKDGTPILKPDGTPYDNAKNDAALINRASRDARYLDLIPLDALIDRRNDPPLIFDVGGDAAQPHAWVPRVGLKHHFDPVEEMPSLPMLLLWTGFHYYQNHVVEVWIEKSTQNDWIIPLCERRGVNLVTGIGEQSEIRARELAFRAATNGKPTRVLYLSDFDPGGNSMPVAVARKVEYTIHKFDLDIDFTLTPLVLTEKQCIDYDLPRIPIKETERRKQVFEKRFGRGATELDAMEALYPGEMARLLEAEIDRYLDPTFRERMDEAKWTCQRELKKIANRVLAPYADDIKELETEYEEIVEQMTEWRDRAETTWRSITDDLEAQKPDLSDHVPPTPRAADERSDPLFDSKRDYFAQIDHYHAWQRRYDG